MNIERRKKVREDAMVRMNSLEFGQRITNVCAGIGNPRRHCLFVGKDYRTRRGHTERYAKCTDGKGKFWSTGIEVIFPEWISHEDADLHWKAISDGVI